MTIIVERYFSDIFHTSFPQTIDQVVSNVEPKITPVMNNSLLKLFTSAEVHEAPFQMHPTKSLGPDSMNALFTRNFGILSGMMLLRRLLNFSNLEKC